MNKVLSFPQGVRQLGEGYCGPNAMRHIISYRQGLEIPETSLMKIGCGSKKKGTSVRGMEKIANEFNLDYNLKCGSSISEVVNSIEQKSPVILLIQAWPNKKICDWSSTWEFGHYVVTIGYNPKEEKLIIYDPYDGKRKFLSYEKLNQRWHDKDSKNIYKNFGMFFRN
jgi:uncharacterized protein YvpB